MRNFKLLIEYDGTCFHGWQIQPRVRTVQGELRLAIARITGEETAVTGAGRTDAGVHAVGQIASFRSLTALAPPVLGRALNAVLPGDVRIRSTEEVPLEFSARFDAKSRTYRYLFIRRPTALWRAYYQPVTGALDIAAMRASLAALVGEKDFAAFASAQDASPSKTCRVIRAELFEFFPLVSLEITADRFLHHMVRSIAGTVLEIGRGKPLAMAAIVEAAGALKAGPTLPAHALYLMEVAY
jgi:tRNA pseudouridine38-40 synthase